MLYAIALAKLVVTGPERYLIFRPLTDVPQTDIFVIWRKYQTFTPIAELLLQELQNRFNL